MRHVYLHGFASSPSSRKAQAFRAALEAVGIDLEIADLAQGDFAHLTISGQLQAIEKLLLASPCRLIGSSMGGFLAAIYAASHPEVERLVLLAPAFAFPTRWSDTQGSKTLEWWRETGWMDFFHYGDRTVRPLHWGIVEDARQYPDFPDAKQPALIFHGVNDSVVSVELSRQFAAAHPSARLRELDSDHELLNVLDRITLEAIPYLNSAA